MTLICYTQTVASQQTSHRLAAVGVCPKFKIIRLPKKRSEKMINVQTKINEILLSKQIDKSLRIAILADLLQSELK
ncbi:MAG: hypothetical protein EAZ85_14960 [Bacteroidetes bacterium]|nr:MAG: hypothetical protein EAZ85_14960 [Bacteroidota bacterium]TAG85417.1 MAG: hypothetical protein EAZ20_15220 [Bacteroidota bacterium]